MKTNLISLTSAILLMSGVAVGCSEAPQEPAGGAQQREMRFEFMYPAGASRATDTAFEPGDCVSLYLKESGSPLEPAGNYVNNECLTFDGSAWNFRMPFYWDEGVYDAVALYPYCGDIASISDFEFDIAAQPLMESAPSGHGMDLMYASVSGVSASTEPVRMAFRHVMSKLTVRLVKGEDYEGALPENATVLVHSTVTRATLDLNAGVVTKDPQADAVTVTARKSGATTYSAILVPQRIENCVPLVEVIVGGVSLVYEGKFQFKPGVHHLLNLVIERNPERNNITIGGEATEW